MSKRKADADPIPVLRKETSDVTLRVKASLTYDAQLEEAENLIPVVGSLYRKHQVVCTLYGKSLVHHSPAEIIKAHAESSRFVETPITVLETGPLIKAIAQLTVSSCVVDIGKVLSKVRRTPIEVQLAPVLNQTAALLPPRDVVLFGFGRIGRLVTRILMAREGVSSLKLRLRVVVIRPNPSDPKDLEKRASLLKRDSVHGPYRGSVTVDLAANTIYVNGEPIVFIYAPSPDAIDYTAHGISNAVLIDNSGKWRDRKGLGVHAACKGVGKVILTAPASGGVKNIVVGVNDEAIARSLAEQDHVVGAASCTTNAVCPVLKAMHQRFGIVHSHMETVHSFTNDQHLVDNYHKKSRRGRAAPLNLVITETGAAVAVSEVIPELAGKLTGNAIRVPTPNVSLAVLVLSLQHATTVEEVNGYLRDVSINSPLAAQIDFSTSDELVSSDVIGARAPSVVDSRATIVQGERVNLYVWYDNEFGYSCQVVRLAQKLTGEPIPEMPL